jgi:hypothetical protein
VRRASRIHSGPSELGFHQLGAGLGTSTAAFIHQATSVNTFGDATLLDYSFINDNSDLLLFVTPNRGKAGCVEDGHAVGLRFVPRSGSIPGSWWIYRADGSSPAKNACYNVLVPIPTELPQPKLYLSSRATEDLSRAAPLLAPQPQPDGPGRPDRARLRPPRLAGRQ